jgi:hypothetical protein
MKKTSLYIEDEVDDALERRARSEGVSKAEIIRRALRAAAHGAPRPRFQGKGVVKGGPRDVAANDEHYLGEWGIGRG